MVKACGRVAVVLGAVIVAVAVLIAKKTKRIEPGDVAAGETIMAGIVRELENTTEAENTTETGNRTETGNTTDIGNTTEMSTTIRPDEIRNWCEEVQPEYTGQLNMWLISFVNYALSIYTTDLYIHQTSVHVLLFRDLRLISGGPVRLHFHLLTSSQLTFGDYTMWLETERIYDYFVMIRANDELYYSYFWSTSDSQNRMRFTFYQCPATPGTGNHL